MPGRAAYVDGRGGASMRLNFSGSREEEIVEGVRRIGRVVSEQVALYETLTHTPGSSATSGSSPSSARLARPGPGEAGAQDADLGGDVVPMKRRRKS